MNKPWFKLSHSNVVFIFIYYLIVFMVGILLTAISLLGEYSIVRFQPVIVKSVVGCIGIACLGSSIFYIRKLYKACIKTDVSYPENPNDKLKQLGVIFYFILRPLFSVGFSLLIIIGIKASILIVTVKETALDSGFIYFTMFLSFFAGFSSGELLNILEQTGKDVLSKLFEKQTE